MNVVALVMAGGKGQRFWPRSRDNNPKQFLVINQAKEKQTMLQKTVKRLSGVVKHEDIYILTDDKYVQIVKEQLPNLPNENIISEPCGRNTAPAINLGLNVISEKYQEFVMLVLPSDHFVMQPRVYVETLKEGINFASKNKALLTIGIVPRSQNTDYGYIKYDNLSNDNVLKVLKFVEKPNLQKAKQYLNDGNYLWNSGMFIWQSEAIKEAFQKYMPKQYAQMEHLRRLRHKHRFLSYKHGYSKLENISIDYGVMEKADNVYTIRGDFGWDDVGSWLALSRVFGKDENKNTCLGNIFTYNSYNSIISSEKPLIVTNGVSDLIIVATNDVVLVSTKDDIHNIKELLKAMKEKKGLDDYI